MTKLYTVELKKSEIQLLLELLRQQYESCEYWGNRLAFDKTLADTELKLSNAMQEDGK